MEGKSKLAFGRGKDKFHLPSIKCNFTIDFDQFAVFVPPDVVHISRHTPELLGFGF